MFWELVIIVSGAGRVCLVLQKVSISSLKKCFFGLRNYGSIRAVQNYLRDDLKDKVVYHPCATTVLSKLYELPERTETQNPFIALNCAFDRAQMRYGDKMDKVMTQIAHVCKNFQKIIK